MHRLLIGAALTLTATACGIPEEQHPLTSHAAITGGVAETGYLAVFALAYNGQGGCSGTCITPKIGLTAQHCVEGEVAPTLSGLFGATEFQPQQTIQVTAIGRGPQGSDIAAVAFADAC